MRLLTRRFLIISFSVASVIGVNADTANLSPQVTIVFPPEGIRVNTGTGVAFKAEASDGDGTIATVEFYNGTNLVGVAITSPYTNLFSARPEDILTLTAVAIDNFGARATSAPVHVIAQQPPTTPTYHITAPTNFATLPATGNVTIEAKLTATDGIEWPAAFFIGTNLVGQVPDPPYRLTVSNLTAGDYTLHVHASSGNHYRPFYPNEFNPIEIHLVPLLLRLTAPATKNGFQFEIAGDVAGNTNLIEASVDLLNWLPLQTNAPSASSFPFLDTETPNYSRRFYRARLGP